MKNIKIEFININTQKEICVDKGVDKDDISLLQPNHIIALNYENYIIKSICHELSTNGHSIKVYVSDDISENLCAILYVPSHIIHTFGPPYVNEIIEHVSSKIKMNVIPFQSEHMEFDIKVFNPNNVNITSAELSKIKSLFAEQFDTKKNKYRMRTKL